MMKANPNQTIHRIHALKICARSTQILWGESAARLREQPLYAGFLHTIASLLPVGSRK
jgi:hypothetical protein